MSFYYLLCCLIFLLAFSCSKVKDVGLLIDLKVCLFFILFLPAALRVGIGTDYNAYVRIFNNIASGKGSGSEVGWVFLNSFVSKAGLSVQWVFAISSCITLIWFFFLDKKYFFMSLFVWFLYYYTNSFNAVRNAISISFFYYACFLSLKNKRAKGFVIILLAAMFHSSALLYIPVYFLICFIPISKKTVLVIAIIGYISLRYLNIAQKIMNSSVIASTRYGGYVTLLQYNKKTEISSGMGILLRHFVLFLTYFLCSEKKSSGREFSIISYLFLSLLFSDVLMTQIYIFSRVRSIFFVGYMAMYTHLFNWKSKNALIELGKYFSLMYSIVFYFIFSIKVNMNEVVPYVSIFGGL